MSRCRINVLLMVSLCGVALSGRVSAHHSIQAQFDINKAISISGTVAKVEFINPHSYLTVNVKDPDGKVQKWAFEMVGLAGLRRAGLSRADRGGLKPGDRSRTIVKTRNSAFNVLATRRLASPSTSVSSCRWNDPATGS